jgi:hypothetical protein
LREMGHQTIGVNVSESARGMDKSGRISFKNLRSELWWRMREALDPNNNTGICLPPDPRILADLCAPTWRPVGTTIAVASREDIVEKIGRSPDFGTAYVLALMQATKTGTLLEDWRKQVNSNTDYDPYDVLRMDLR